MDTAGIDVGDLNGITALRVDCVERERERERNVADPTRQQHQQPWSSSWFIVTSTIAFNVAFTSLQSRHSASPAHADNLIGRVGHVTAELSMGWVDPWVGSAS